MPTLKEILAERKRKDSQANTPESKADTQVSTQTPQLIICNPHNEFYALFEGCTEF